jgi:hypothetical protein
VITGPGPSAMGKSPAKWIKAVLFGKKTSKSNISKGREVILSWLLHGSYVLLRGLLFYIIYTTADPYSKDMTCGARASCAVFFLPSLWTLTPKLDGIIQIYIILVWYDIFLDKE